MSGSGLFYDKRLAVHLLGSQVPQASTFFYFDTDHTGALAPVTPFALSLLALSTKLAVQQALDLEPGVDVQPYDADLAAIAALAGTGLLARTAADTWAQRTITGTANQIQITNGTGVSGNPTVALASPIVNIVGNGTGGANTAYIQFTESDGSTVTGFVGDSSASQAVFLASIGGNLAFVATNAITMQLSTTSLFPNTDSAIDLGQSGNTWQTAWVEGVRFPATQVPAADANTLDDYEEGTYTPSISFTTPGNLVVAYAERAGTYRKVGRIVFTSTQLVTSTFTHTTSSGDLVITGKPFAAGGIRTFGSCNISAWTYTGGRTDAFSAMEGNIDWRIKVQGSNLAPVALNTTNHTSGVNSTIHFSHVYSSDV